MPKTTTTVTRKEFETVRQMLEDARRKTRPRKHDLFDVFNAALHYIDTGISWRAMPKHFPPWRTVHEYSMQWQRAGLLEKALIDLGKKKAPQKFTGFGPQK